MHDFCKAAKMNVKGPLDWRWRGLYEMGRKEATS